MMRRIAPFVAAVASLLLVGPTAPALAQGSSANALAGAEVYRGLGFDTCQAPSLNAMAAWTESPYNALGVYIGGRGRACPQQKHLDPAWVRNVSTMGWKLLPLYVGSQSPCVHSARKRPFAIDSGAARQQGTREGRDAVAQAQALGMGRGSAIYLDMEAYDQGNAGCARTTLTFVQAWNRAVRGLGYLPGFYSSVGSGVAHMEQARRAGAQDLPAAVWFARWNGKPNVQSTPYLADGAWEPHRRIHQYRGNVRETYGGVTVNIDRNLVDAPVAVIP